MSQEFRARVGFRIRNAARTTYRSKPTAKCCSQHNCRVYRRQKEYDKLPLEIPASMQLSRPSDQQHEQRTSASKPRKKVSYIAVESPASTRRSLGKLQKMNARTAMREGSLRQKFPPSRTNHDCYVLRKRRTNITEYQRRWCLTSNAPRMVPQIVRRAHEGVSRFKPSGP